MKRKRILGIVICAALLIVAAQRMVTMQSRFDGSRVCNSDTYLLEFSQMNRDDACSLHMEAGNMLRVEYEIQRGRVDVCVDVEGNGPIYRGNRVESGSFALPAARTGEYMISVHAENAWGRLFFAVEKAPEPS